MRRRGLGAPALPTCGSSQCVRRADVFFSAGAGLSGARGAWRSQLRLHPVPGGGAGRACALAACRLLGNRVREEPMLFYKGAGTHDDSCP